MEKPDTILCTGCGKEAPITYISEGTALCASCVCQTGPCLLAPGHTGPATELLSMSHRIACSSDDTVAVAVQRGEKLVVVALHSAKSKQLHVALLNKKQLRRLQASLRQAEELLP